MTKDTQFNRQLLGIEKQLPFIKQVTGGAGEALIAVQSLYLAVNSGPLIPQGNFVATETTVKETCRGVIEQRIMLLEARAFIASHPFNILSIIHITEFCLAAKRGSAPFFPFSIIYPLPSILHPQPSSPFHTMPNLHSTPLPTDFIAAEARVAPAAEVAFLEGPAADAQGNVYFTDIWNNRILKYDSRRSHTRVWSADSGRSNGLLFDVQGRLLACEGNEFGPGGRRPNLPS